MRGLQIAAGICPVSGDFSRMFGKAGFKGVEFAPYTVFGDFSGDNDRMAINLRHVLDGEDLSFRGLSLVACFAGRFAHNGKG